MISGGSNMIRTLATVICMACCANALGRTDRREWNIPVPIQIANSREHVSSIPLFLPLPSKGHTAIFLRKSSSIDAENYAPEQATEEDCTIYQDIGPADAYFEVCNYGTNLEMKGTFWTAGLQYDVMPSESGHAHQIRAIFFLSMHGLRTMREEESGRQQATGTSFTPTRQNYEIELAVFADYEIFKKYKNRTDPNLSSSERRDNAVTDLRKYLLYMTNQINSRFFTLSEDFNIDIKVKVVNLAINTVSNEEPSLKPTFLSERVGKVQGEDAAASFQQYLEGQSGTLHFDHAILVTGFDLTEDGGGIFADAPAGFAKHGTMCGPSPSVSVIKYKGAFVTSSIASHFLSRSLGVPMDGLGTDPAEAENCDVNLGYIMAPYSDPAQLTDPTHYHRFSSCSGSFIRNFLGFLDYENKNCLVNIGKEWPTVKAADLPSLNDEFNPHYMCTDLHGPGWVFASGLKMTVNICSSLVCTNPVLRVTRASYMGARGVDGTICGPGMKCLRGTCEFDADVPFDTCPYGNYRVMPETGDLKCHSFHPRECYTPVVAAKCCKACLDLKKLELPGHCQWGDHSKSCKTKSVADCSDSAVAKDCCELCGKGPARLHTGNEEIITDYTPSDCVNMNNNYCRVGQSIRYMCSTEYDRYMCCEQCNMILKGRTDICPSGDHRSDCEFLATQGWCNHEQFRTQTCCYSCQLRQQYPPLPYPTPIPVPQPTPPQPTPAQTQCSDLIGTERCLSMRLFCASGIDVQRVCCRTCTSVMPGITLPPFQPQTFTPPVTMTTRPVIPVQACSHDRQSLSICNRMKKYCAWSSVLSMCCVTCGGQTLPPTTSPPPARCTGNSAGDQNCALLARYCDTNVDIRTICCATCYGMQPPVTQPPMVTFPPVTLPPVDCYDNFPIGNCMAYKNMGQCGFAIPSQHCCATCRGVSGTYTPPTMYPPIQTTRPSCYDQNPQQCSISRAMCYDAAWKNYCCYTCSTGNPGSTVPPRPPVQTARPEICNDKLSPRDCLRITHIAKLCGVADGRSRCCNSCVARISSNYPSYMKCVTPNLYTEAECNQRVSDNPVGCADDDLQQVCCRSCQRLVIPEFGAMPTNPPITTTSTTTTTTTTLPPTTTTTQLPEGPTIGVCGENMLEYPQCPDEARKDPYFCVQPYVQQVCCRTCVPGTSQTTPTTATPAVTAKETTTTPPRTTTSTTTQPPQVVTTTTQATTPTTTTTTTTTTTARPPVTPVACVDSMDSCQRVTLSLCQQVPEMQTTCCISCRMATDPPPPPPTTLSPTPPVGSCPTKPSYCIDDPGFSCDYLVGKCYEAGAVYCCSTCWCDPDFNRGAIIRPETTTTPAPITTASTAVGRTTTLGTFPDTGVCEDEAGDDICQLGGNQVCYLTIGIASQWCCKHCAPFFVDGVPEFTPAPECKNWLSDAVPEYTCEIAGPTYCAIEDFRVLCCAMCGRGRLQEGESVGYCAANERDTDSQLCAASQCNSPQEHKKCCATCYKKTFGRILSGKNLS